MQFADAVAMATHSQRQNGHAEWIGAIDPGLSEREQFVEGKTDIFCEIAEILSHHLLRERIVSSGDWRVSGKNVGRRDDLKRRIKIEFLVGDVATNSFEREKRRMPFVHMIDIRFNPECAKRSNAADAEDDLLAHPHFLIPAVKLSGD